MQQRGRNMKKRNRLFILCLIIGILCTNTLAFAKEMKLPSEIAVTNIGTEIENYVDEHSNTTAGMAVAIFNNEDEIYKNYFGYADIENQILVDNETVFEWGSASKLLVWVSVMQLWEQEEIDLNEDIRKYLPEDFLSNLKYDTPITMLNLMNHNAGFQEVYVDLFVSDGISLPSLEEALLAHEPKQIYEPGTVTAYSNWGVALAAYTVERISGMNFSEYVHKNIFEPLEMEYIEQQGQ